MKFCNEAKELHDAPVLLLSFNDWINLLQPQMFWRRWRHETGTETKMMKTDILITSYISSQVKGLLKDVSL